MKNLERKVVLVTGGASGIGLGIAQAFLESSCQVIIADINVEHMRDAQEQLQQDGFSQVDFVALNVADDDSWAAVVEKLWGEYGGIDILVNNAGIGQGVLPDGSQARAWEFSPETRDQLLDVNVAGVMRGVQHVVPRMVKRNAGGHVITTASLSGVYAVPGISLYSASKFAVVGYSEALAGELDSYGIGVSILCPASVKSQLKATAARRVSREAGSALDDYQKNLDKAFSTKMDPLSVGRAVVTAVQRNDLYVMTHPAHKQAVRSRHALIEKSFTQAAEPGYVEPDAAVNAAMNPAYRRRQPVAGSQPAIIVTTAQVESEHEDDFNRWFDYEHAPERSACAGFMSARRFKSVDGQDEYLAVYEVEDLQVLESPEYRAMTGRSVWQDEVSQHVTRASRQVYVDVTNDIDPADRIHAERLQTQEQK